MPDDEGDITVGGVFAAVQRGAMAELSRVVSETGEQIRSLDRRSDDLADRLARIEGQMGYIRSALHTRELAAAAEASAALEVRKSAALERIRDAGAQQNHRRELMIKVMAIITTAAGIIGAILGS